MLAVKYVLYMYMYVYCSDHCTASPPCECVFPYVGDACDTVDYCAESWNFCEHGTCFPWAANGRGKKKIKKIYKIQVFKDFIGYMYEYSLLNGWGILSCRLQPTKHQDEL